MSIFLRGNIERLVKTVTALGATSADVLDTTVTKNSIIIFTLKSDEGGTVGAYPVVKVITPGAGFTMQTSALDVSIYNYLVL